jgi:aminoglycoside phosphotransferase (APT) family kinase protein
LSALDDLAAALGRYLSDEWSDKVEIQDLAVASAGARRRNVLFDAVTSRARTPLVATIIPNAAIQVMPMSVEASSLRLAEAAGAPAPHVHAASDDATILGGPFFLTSRIDGETIPRRVLRLVAENDGLGAKIAHQCGEALACIHSVDPKETHPELPGADQPIEAALSGARALLDGLLQPSPAFTLGWNWLERNRPPEPSRRVLIHGDFRNGNLIIGSDGLRAALDWEVGHLGDPMEDPGWLCQRMWRFRNDSLEVGGLGTRAELRAGYEAAGGEWDEARFLWWKSMGTLRWGMGLAGQASAHLDGSVRSIIMAASGKRVAELEYDLLMLLKPGFN